MIPPAIRFLAAKGATGLGTIHLVCHVKPGVSASREGISSVTNEAVHICVSAQAKDGEANKAVRELVAEALNVATSDVGITRGLKSREKTVAVNVSSTKSAQEDVVERIKIMLLGSVGR